MYLRWTDIEPVVHLRTEVDRGLAKRGDPKYCFVQYTEIEQNEPGDTIYHTFTFPSWEYCFRRWWYFIATIEGKSTPSNTGILTDHCDYPGPEPDKYITVITNITDCMWQGVSPSYTYAHDMPSSTYLTDSGLSVYYVGQWLTYGVHWVHRMGLYFPVPTFPQGINISSIKLRIWAFFLTSDIAFVHAVDGTPIHEPAIKEDYGALLGQTESLGSVEVKTGVWKWFDIELNEAGRALVIPEQTCKLALRTERDINSIPPYPHDRVQVRTADISTIRAARLRITYRGG